MKGKLNDLRGLGKTSLMYNESPVLGIACNRGAKPARANLTTKKFTKGCRGSAGVFDGEYIDAKHTAIEGLWSSNALSR